jgi:hypothetical protein
MGVKRFLHWTFFPENVRKSAFGCTCLGYLGDMTLTKINPICVTLPKVAEVNKASIATVAGDFAIFY